MCTLNDSRIMTMLSQTAIWKWRFPDEPNPPPALARRRSDNNRHSADETLANKATGKLSAIENAVRIAAAWWAKLQCLVRVASTLMITYHALGWLYWLCPTAALGYGVAMLSALALCVIALEYARGMLVAKTNHVGRCLMCCLYISPVAICMFTGWYAPEHSAGAVNEAYWASLGTHSAYALELKADQDITTNQLIDLKTTVADWKHKHDTLEHQMARNDQAHIAALADLRKNARVAGQESPQNAVIGPADTSRMTRTALFSKKYPGITFSGNRATAINSSECTVASSSDCAASSVTLYGTVTVIHAMKKGEYRQIVGPRSRSYTTFTCIQLENGKFQLLDEEEQLTHAKPSFDPLVMGFTSVGLKFIHHVFQVLKIFK